MKQNWNKSLYFGGKIMNKKILTLISTGVFAASCFSIAVFSKDNSFSNLVGNATGEPEPEYTLKIDSPLYEGEESGVDYTYVKTGNNNDIKIKYNKLKPFQTEEGARYTTGFNSLVDGSYIEIVQNNSIHGLTGIKQVVIKAFNLVDTSRLRIHYGWENGVMEGYEEIIVSDARDYDYVVSLDDGPSYIKIEAVSSYLAIVPLHEIDITYSCSKQTNPYATVGDFKLHRVENHYEVTRYTGESTSITGIPSEVNELPVTTIGENFIVDIGKENITSVTLPDSITTLGFRAFYRAKKLTTINLDKVTHISNQAFYMFKEDESQLKGLNLGSVTYIGEMAFQNCYLSDDQYTFNSLSVWIDNYAFKDTEVRAIFFPSDSNASVEIRYQAFYGCTHLLFATFPVNITALQGGAFENCSSLATLRYYGTTTQWNNISKTSGWNTNIYAKTIRCIASGESVDL